MEHININWHYKDMV